MDIGTGGGVWMVDSLETLPCPGCILTPPGSQPPMSPWKEFSSSLKLYYHFFFLLWFWEPFQVLIISSSFSFHYRLLTFCIYPLLHRLVGWSYENLDYLWFLKDLWSVDNITAGCCHTRSTAATGLIYIQSCASLTITSTDDANSLSFSKNYPRGKKCWRLWIVFSWKEQ